ncbi:hypothetical protein, partial [Mesorhizobium sp.]
MRRSAKGAARARPEISGRPEEQSYITNESARSKPTRALQTIERVGASRTQGRLATTPSHGLLVCVIYGTDLKDSHGGLDDQGKCSSFVLMPETYDPKRRDYPLSTLN